MTSLQSGAIDLSEISVSNSGLMYGSGFLTAGFSFTNLANGELRTLESDWARVDSTVNINAGEINNFGGVVEFTGVLFNEFKGFIAGRGLFAANGGLGNSGAMALAGGADILGDVQNTGTIVTSGMSSTVFYDDVVHNGTEIRTSAGSSTVFFGALSGAGSFTGTGAVFVEGDLRPGNSPATVMFAGDLVLGSGAITEVELSGVKPNEFDQLNVAGNLSIGGTLTVVLIDEFELEPDQEFLIADIGGSLTGQFSNYGEGDLVGNFGGIDLFITYGGGDGNDVVLQSLPDNPVLLGDLNEDGLVNLLDITPFVNLIESGGYQAEADCNEDGVVNLLDVNPFIMILSGG